MRRLRITAAAAVVLFAVAACAMDPSYDVEDYSCTFSRAHDTSSHPQRDSLQALLDDGAADGLPGVVMYVRTPDGATWVGAAGMADLAYRVPMSPCNHMLVASVTKVFTATMIFSLQEEGLLDIDDRLDIYLEDAILDNLENGHDVTLRQMLNHTSGLYDYLDAFTYDLDTLQSPSRVLSQEEKLEYAYGKPATNRPGEAFYYSNTNYALLGMVVEEITGRFLGDAMDDTIFAPLNLTSAYYGSHRDPIPANTPRGYFLLFGRDRIVDSRHIYINDLNTGEGGIAINMQDLGTFIEELLAGSILDPVSVDEMRSEAVAIPEEDRGLHWSYDGYGFEIYDTPYGRAYGHTGAIYGFLTVLFHFPDTGATLAFSVNGTSPDIMSVREAMIDDALEIIFGAEAE